MFSCLCLSGRSHLALAIHLGIDCWLEESGETNSTNCRPGSSNSWHLFSKQFCAECHSCHACKSDHLSLNLALRFASFMT